MTKKWVRWTARESAELIALQERGDNWADIAEALGRTLPACQGQFYKIRPVNAPYKPRAPRVGAQVAPELPELVSVVAIAQAPAKPPGARCLSTAVLVADAELRARIAVLGLTAGLLGDPLPGRSALDMRLAGVPEPATPADHREVALRRLRPTITLAKEPLR